MNVSVIIPAYNAQGTIGQTLKALAEQDYSKPFVVIVVDDGSTDKTADIVRSFANVRYLHQSNAGPAAARNHGARTAKAEILAFTDSDCVPHKNWLSQLTNGFKSEDIAVVMGSYGIANPNSLLAGCVFQEIAFRHKNLLSDHPKVFGSYNFCVKKNVFDRVGGFNAVYRNASGEDNDLSYKIISTGAKIYFQRNALVDHYHPVSVKKYLKEQFRHGYWRVMMYASHPQMIKGDGYTFWKDMIEIPLSILTIIGMLLAVLNGSNFNFLFIVFLSAFIVFEFIFALAMLNDVNKGIFWGIVMFLRALSRTFGLSTGFLMSLGEKKANKP